MSVDRFVLISVLAAVNGTPCFSQASQASVSIGGHEISLGMPVERALTALRQAGRIEPVVEVPVHRWVVYDGKNELVASVKAEGNVIASVSFLLLGHSLTSSQDMFDAIFAATSKLKSLAKDAQPCEITTSSDYDAKGGSNAVVHFYCRRSSGAPLGTYRIELRRSAAKSAAKSDNADTTVFDVWGEIGAWPPSVP